MASSFAVTISAKDDASGTLAAINKRMASVTKQVELARAPFDRLAANATKFSRVTGIDKIASSLGGVARSGFSAFQSVARIVEPLAAISGAASIAGMVRLATAWADFGSQLGNTATRAGLTSDQLMVLQNAGRLAGVSAEALSGGMTGLRDNMVNAVGGKAPQVIGMLQALGLSMNDAKRFAADTTKALPELADKIAGLKDPTLQAEAATALFGGAGEAMLPFLRKGSAGIAEYTEKARKYGLINADGVAAANQLREAQTTLTMAIEGLGNSIAQRLGPVLTPLLTQMADWIAANRDWIAQGIGDKVKDFADYLRSVDWAKVGTDVLGIVHAVTGLVDALGGIVPAAEIVVGFMGVAWLARMMLPILAISKALLGLPGKAAVATAEAEAAMAKGGAGGGLMKGLAGMAGFGLLQGVFSGQMGRDAAANLDERDRQAANPTAAGPDTRHWWEKLYKPGPGLLSGSGQQKTFDTTLTPQARGLLDTIAGTESPGYNVMYGGKRFDDYSHHPGVGNVITSGPNAGQTSSAAGRYQFLKSTWDEASAATGARDFSPASQDKAGWWLAQRDYNKKTGRDLSADLSSKDPAVRAGIGAALHGTWTSLPGGIEAGTNDSKFNAALARNTARETGPALSLPSNAGTAASPGAGTPIAPAGQVNIGVQFANTPPGTQTTAVQSGAGLAPLKIERSGVGYDTSRLS